jgi:NADH:ubiquinone oxidoreductase subunit F (NADH-binding)
MIKERRIILKNTGLINPEKIEDYIASGGYKSAAKALGIVPAELIEIITRSGLKGRGGAGFSTGLKLEYTYRNAVKAPFRFLVCNADEGEPGTFKDRVIMENDPHLLLEGMIIAAYIIGAAKAYIYIRGEYFRSIEVLAKAIAQAEEHGFLGNRIFGTGYSLNIELRQGAGSYLCGEEFTLIESLEGRRGYPRIKPPYPAEKGLFGAPTLVNNVETLSNLPVIIENGAEWFSSIGIPGSAGTKILTVSGDVAKPGYLEVEMGITIRNIIYGLAGGIPGGKKFKAAMIGGSAGTFISSDVLDTALGFDSLKNAGAVMGSGAIMVLNEDRDIRKMTYSVLRFFNHESCGKCVPCRVGTLILTRAMKDILKNKGASSYTLDYLISEAEYMAGTSLCPLGQSPIIPLKSLKEFFSREFLYEET